MSRVLRSVTALAMTLFLAVPPVGVTQSSRLDRGAGWRRGPG